jgi:hypothetical protein
MSKIKDYIHEHRAYIFAYGVVATVYCSFIGGILLGEKAGFKSGQIKGVQLGFGSALCAIVRDPDTMVDYAHQSIAPARMNDAIEVGKRVIDIIAK